MSSYLSSHGLERRADGVAAISIECAALQPQTATRADRMAKEGCLKPESAAELHHCGILVRTRWHEEVYLHDSARLKMPLGSSPPMLGAAMKLLSEMLPKLEKRGLMLEIWHTNQCAKRATATTSISQIKLSRRLMQRREASDLYSSLDLNKQSKVR